MNLKKKSWLLFSIFLLCLALILPGCITATYETKVNSDGSGQRIQDLAIDESFAGLLDSSAELKGKGGLEAELKKNMPKDAKYKKFTKEGKVHHQVTFDFKDVDELNKINKQLNTNSDVPKTVEAKLEKAEYLVFATYKFRDEFPATSKGEMKPEEEQLAKAMSVTYKLTLPGKITKAEKAEDIKDDTATWHVSPTQGGKVEATSRYVRWWLIIVLLFALIFIVIVSAILIFLGVRKKKYAGSQEPVQPQEPDQLEQPKQPEQPKPQK